MTSSSLPGSPERITQALRNVPGLSVDTGLRHLLDNHGVYARLAQRVVNERADLSAQLLGAMGQQDFTRAAALLHGARSVLATLGASALAESCLTLEHALRAGQPEPAAARALAADYDTLLAGLGQALGDAGTPALLHPIHPTSGIRT
jgi:HPt (histidine-containing phosphotransfer) domain-containing protein